jgi:endonuclease-3
MARATPFKASNPLRSFVLDVHEKLCALYGCPVPYFHNLDPLSELVSSLLSHRTKNKDSGRAFKTLRANFSTWEAVRDADTRLVQTAISASTWPEQKAPRLQQILRSITDLHGDLNLDFLADMPVEEARAWLESLPGVGPKTSAAVLLFSNLRRPALPVDSHHYRVAVRLGIVPATMGEGKSHAALASLLPSDWDAQQVYDHHEVMMFHGQRCCYFYKPECDRCVLLSQCPTGQTRLNSQAAPLPVPELTLTPHK